MNTKGEVELKRKWEKKRACTENMSPSDPAKEKEKQQQQHKTNKTNNSKSKTKNHVKKQQ